MLSAPLTAVGKVRVWNNEAFAARGQKRLRRRTFRERKEVNKRIGVSDGIRTRDVQIHNLALYQAELRSPRRKTEPYFL